MMAHLCVKYACVVEFTTGMDLCYKIHYQVKGCDVKFVAISKNGFMMQNASYK
jgi:hypothetical protein